MPEVDLIEMVQMVAASVSVPIRLLREYFHMRMNDQVVEIIVPIPPTNVGLVVYRLFNDILC